MATILIRGALALALAGAAFVTPAAAFPLGQYVTADQLKDHCDAAGGTFSQAGNLSACATDKGSVSCNATTRKCTGTNSHGTSDGTFEIDPRLTLPTITTTTVIIKGPPDIGHFTLPTNGAVETSTIALH